MIVWYITEDEALKCPNERCRSGFAPREHKRGEAPGFYCVDCGAKREPWPESEVGVLAEEEDGTRRPLRERLPCDGCRRRHCICRDVCGHCHRMRVEHYGNDGCQFTDAADPAFHSGKESPNGNG